MSAPRLLSVLAIAALALVLGSSGSAGPAPQPGVAAQAFAVKVAVPGHDDVSTPIVSAPPAGSSALDSYSTQGVQVGAITVGATTQPGDTAVAAASADLSAVSLFGGEITADGVSGRAKATAGPGGASGDVSASAVANLAVLGQKVDPKPNLRVPLADWGYLIVLGEGSDTSAPKGAKGYRGFTTGLDVHLNTDHGGLPAGTEILVGYAEAAAMTAPPSAPTETTTETTPVPRGAGGISPHHLTRPDLAGKSKHAKKKKKSPQPLKVKPKLGRGDYVFPVYGTVSFGDTYGAGRSDVADGWHHGDDIFGDLGQPVVAVVGGTVFSVGWNKLGGNRFWLRDRHGNQFYYAHLAAYSTNAADGAHVHAGEVLGFMGNTGDAEGTPYHLHFEVHPVSLLFKKYDGAVDPTTYLDRWRRLRDVNFGSTSAWVPAAHNGSARAPQPGAMLLQSTDVSQAASLDPASLRRSLARPPQP